MFAQKYKTFPKGRKKCVFIPVWIRMPAEVGAKKNRGARLRRGGFPYNLMKSLKVVVNEDRFFINHRRCLSLTIQKCGRLCRR